MKKKLAVAVVGPTASGKTSLAIEIAKKIGGEIVSADSMQIYRTMDIATAKPTAFEQSEVKHHLIDIVNPDEEFSVATFKEKALEAMRDIVSRGKIPVVAGGTGFYVDTLVNNTEFLDFDKSDIRKSLEETLREKGIEALYEKLGEVDPESYKRLHINDTKRILRALEVYYATGKTITVQAELSHQNEGEFDFCIIGLNAENRQLLYDRINLRVDLMLGDGLIEETKLFFKSNTSSTSKQAIGYKELKPFLDGEMTLEEATENLKRETRRYAKRQLTWFRRNEKINWIYIDGKNKDDLLNEAVAIIDNFSGEEQ